MLADQSIIRVMEPDGDRILRYEESRWQARSCRRRYRQRRGEAAANSDRLASRRGGDAGRGSDVLVSGPAYELGGGG
ncbi:hypothetical protein Tco_0051237 [Tanacetum coccineum]|uniref:Uncharacterized protein n=1 Tax=Tanacetum coccineum TaxID=301880 RepID=A0ABQ4Z704_9ASTR